MGFDRAAMETPKGSSRARRYEIGTPIRYRVRGEREWREGVTENISISGVLIRTSHALEPNTSIEMKFLLPVELEGEFAAEVFCRGLVVRSSHHPAPAGAATIAARILHSRFLRQTGRNEELSGAFPGFHRRLEH
jgi:hypothetical protein